MKIGLVQYNPVWEDIEANKKEIIRLLKEFNSSVDLLIFPELTLTGFTMNPDKFFSDLESGNVGFFSALAKERNTNIVFGDIIKDDDNLFNTLLLLDRNGDLIKHYHKIHPFSYGDENKHYSAGKDTVIAEIDGVKTGFTICYDLRFPELYRFYGKERVELIINIANWPITRIHHWKTLLKARAIENQAFVAAVNRTGNDPQLIYNGCSSVYDPMGDELCCIDKEVKIQLVETDLEFVGKVRKKFSFLEDIKLI